MRTCWHPPLKILNAHALLHRQVGQNKKSHLLFLIPLTLEQSSSSVCIATCEKQKKTKNIHLRYSFSISQDIKLHALRTCNVYDD